MVRKVVWTEYALRDLEDITNYIALDSKYYAASFVRTAKEAASTLDQLSERGRIVPELGNTRIREIFVNGYRLFYLVSPDIVYVIGFVHGARDIQSLWDDESRLDV